MVWRRDRKAETEYDAKLVEGLYRDDDGAILGTIIRFWDDGATYAYSAVGNRRLGGFKTDDAARAAVEQHREAFERSGSALK